MDLTPEPLTPQEQTLLDVMVRRGRWYDDTLYRAKGELRSTATKGLEALQGAWEGLSDHARSLLSHILQDRAGVSDADAVDVGAAVAEVLEIIEYKRRPAPAFNEAVAALYDIWCKRDRSPVVRHLHRDLRPSGDRDTRAKNEPRGPSDLHVFIAKHLIAIFGREPFSRNDDAQVLKMACIAADTALTGR